MFDKEYWDIRWKNSETGWDIGHISPALRNYIDGLQDKSVSIMIPGCGNAYEAEYLLEKGFTDVTVVDISPAALEQAAERLKGAKTVCADFFQYVGLHDIIIEQTFFCALDPSLRKEYVEKMHTLLKPHGVLTGLLFNVDFAKAGPPFGGAKEEYEGLFSSQFDILKLEDCQESISPRAGTELLFEFRNKG